MVYMPEEDRATEEILQEQFEDEEEQVPSGSEEVLFALADALRTKRSKEAFASLLQHYADDIPRSGPQ